MLTIFGRRQRVCGGATRRDLLRACGEISIDSYTLVGETIARNVSRVL